MTTVAFEREFIRLCRLEGEYGAITAQEEQTAIQEKQAAMSKDESPNGLGPVNAARVLKMSRWPLVFVSLFGLLLLGILLYSVNFAHNLDEDESKQVQIGESEKPPLLGKGGERQ